MAYLQLNYSITSMNVVKDQNFSLESLEYYFNQSFAPFAILTGPDFVFAFANQAYIKLMNGRQLVGKRVEEAIPELKGQSFLSFLSSAYETGEPYHMPEIEAIAIFEGDTEPSTRYFNLLYTPYKKPSGEIAGILASGYDITKEVELKRKEEKEILDFQAYNLFMQAPVGFSLVLGNDHRLVVANATGLSIAGKGQEIIGKTVSEILPEIENQRYIDLLDRVKNSGETIKLVESPVTLIKNGKEETLFVNLIYQPYYEGKEIAGVLSISTDATEQVLARKDLERLSNRFETLANNIPNLAWMANRDGWIFWYNNRWYDYTGTTPEQMEGWGWKSVHDPEKLPEVVEKWQLSIDTGKPFEMVFPIRGADGIFRPFLTRVIPVLDDEGHIINWFGTNTDITKQKELEQMKEDFISITSHELKTPLTTIKAYGQIAEMMLKKKGDTETLGMIEKMGSQVNRLTALIEELLDVTKVKQGKLTYHETLFDLNSLVKEVIDDMQNIITTHQIVTEFTQPAKVYADKDKISQVLNNLITNAVKYSSGQEKIIVSTKLKDKGIVVSVQDFGLGIEKEDHENVFEQFYRISGKRSTFPGLGIGLYIAREILKRQDGKIWVESELNKGSIFYFWLPVVN